MERYILQKSAERPYWWVVEDAETGVAVQFEEGKFDGTQCVIPSAGNPQSDIEETQGLKEIAGWLAEKHCHLLRHNLSEACEKAAANVGRQLAEGRRAAGMSIRELARACGVNYAHLCLIENGKKAPTVSTLAKMGKVLGITFTI